jgi:hypothetical protein
MERQDPHASRGTGADEPLDPFPHLARRLVRERDREDLPGRHVALPHQERDAVREGPRLAAAGTGDDQDGPVVVQDGLALDVVQAVEQRRCDGHRRSVGAGADGTVGCGMSSDFRSMVARGNGR